MSRHVHIHIHDAEREVPQSVKEKAARIASMAGARVASIRYEGASLRVKYEKEGKIVDGPTVNGFPVSFQVDYLKKAFQ